MLQRQGTHAEYEAFIVHCGWLMARCSSLDFMRGLVSAQDEVAESDMIPTGHDVTCAFHASCLLYTSPSPRDGLLSRMPSSA